MVHYVSDTYIRSRARIDELQEEQRELERERSWCLTLIWIVLGIIIILMLFKSPHTPNDLEVEALRLVDIYRAPIDAAMAKKIEACVMKHGVGKGLMQAAVGCFQELVQGDSVSWHFIVEGPV